MNKVICHTILVWIVLLSVLFASLASAQGTTDGDDVSCSYFECDRYISIDVDDLFFEFNEPHPGEPDFESRVDAIANPNSVAQLRRDGFKVLGTYEVCKKEGCSQKCSNVKSISEESAYVSMLYPNGGNWQAVAVVGEGFCSDAPIEESPPIDTAEFPPLLPGGESGEYATLDPKQVGDIMIGIANNAGLLSGIKSLDQLIALLAFKVMVKVTNPLVTPPPPVVATNQTSLNTDDDIPEVPFDSLCDVNGKKGRLSFWETGSVSHCREVGDTLVAQISDWSFSFVYDMEFEQYECPDPDIPLDLQLLIGVKEYYCSNPYDGDDKKKSICSREITDEPLVKYCPVEAECGDGTIQNPPETCDPGLTMGSVASTLEGTTSDKDQSLKDLYPSLGNSDQDTATKDYVKSLSRNPSQGPQGWTQASCVTRIPTNVRGFAGTKPVFGECVDSCTRCDVCGDGRLINGLEECDPPGEGCSKYINAYLVAWDDIDSIHAIVGTDQYLDTIARIAIELQGDCGSTCGCTVLPGTYQIIGDSSLAGQTFALSEHDRSKLTAAPTEYFGRAIGSTVKAIPLQTSVNCAVPCTATMKVEKSTGNVFSISDNNQCPVACGGCTLDATSYSNKRKTGEEDLARDVGHPLGDFKVDVYELSGSCQSSKK